MNRIRLFNSNQEEIDLESLGLIGLKLEIPSPSYDIKTESLDGLAGEIVIEKKLMARSLIARFMSISTDYIESLQARDQLFAMLGNGQIWYFSETKNPHKWWKSHLNGWVPERVNAMVDLIEVPLFVESGLSESITQIEKTFDKSIFSFNNEGNETINPEAQSETEIEFTGASTDLVIRNLTTNKEWSWVGSTIASDTILLKGVRSLKNGVSILGQSNKKVIKIPPGWNDFEVIGAEGDFELTIRSRFYFL